MSSDEEKLDVLLRQLASLRIQEDQIRAQEEQVLEQIRTLRRSSAPDRPVFEVGDRVRITNRVNRPSGWKGAWDAQAVSAFRRATVTEVTNDRIQLRTDSGIHTWRAPKNVTALP